MEERTYTEQAIEGRHKKGRKSLKRITLWIFIGITLIVAIVIGLIALARGGSCAC